MIALFIFANHEFKDNFNNLGYHITVTMAMLSNVIIRHLTDRMYGLNGNHSTEK